MKKLREKAGTTLIETVVALVLTSILMAMVVAIISPACKTFLRMQRLQFAQLILDNLEDEIRSQLQDAVGKVKIYKEDDADNPTDKSGSGSGPMLEYLNTAGYVVLMSADGCVETTLIRSGQETGKESVDKGRLLMRYYWQTKADTDSTPYEYIYHQGGKPVARAVQQVFTNGYYMGNYLKLTFSYPSGVAEKTQVNYLNIKAELYRDEARTDLLVTGDFVAELRYEAVRCNDATATNQSAAMTP